MLRNVSMFCRRRAVICTRNTRRPLTSVTAGQPTGIVPVNFDWKDLVKQALAPHRPDLYSASETRTIAYSYLHSSDAARRAFIDTLVQDFQYPSKRIGGVLPSEDFSDIIANRKAEMGVVDHVSVPQLTTQDSAQRHIPQVLNTLTPSYVRLFTQLSQTQHLGVEMFTRLRKDILAIQEEQKMGRFANSPYTVLLHYVTKAIVNKITAVPLEVKRLDMNSDKRYLEFIIRKEAVHPYLGDKWNALAQRLRHPNKFCFALFHPLFPTPLAFVHVSLHGSWPRSYENDVLEAVVLRPEQCTHAIFYTITSPHSFLAGIPDLQLGNSLIKRVSSEIRNLATSKLEHDRRSWMPKEIQRWFKHVHKFGTLSPIPGFRRWVGAHYNAADEYLWSVDLAPQEVKRLMDIPHQALSEKDVENLRKLCLQYLIGEKRRGRVFDSVANFHCRNGAMLENVHSQANLTSKGIAESFGFMVNYHYEDVEAGYELWRQGGIRLSKPLQLEWDQLSKREKKSVAVIADNK